MTGALPPNSPSWLVSAQEVSPGKFAYKVALGPGKHQYTLEFNEQANLSPTDLSIRQLGHMMLLKNLEQLAGKLKPEDLDKCMQAGRQIELVTDKPALEASDKAAIAFKPLPTEAGGPVFCFKPADPPTLQPITSNREDFFKTTFFTDLTHVSTKHGIALKKRLETVRESIFPKKQPPPPVIAHVP